LRVRTLIIARRYVQLRSSAFRRSRPGIRRHRVSQEGRACSPCM